jgi:hypothetical protein
MVTIDTMMEDLLLTVSYIIQAYFSEFYMESAWARASCIHDTDFRIRDEGLDLPDMCQ